MAAVVLAGVAFGGWELSQLLSRPTQPAVVDPAERHAAWVRDTQTVLAQFDRDHDAAKARDALLALRVNAADKGLHQELVFAFEASVAQEAGAEGRLRAARQQFSSLTTNP